MARSVIESNVMEYTCIKDISGYTCIVIGEDENSYYEKEFRYSSDKILWSDYKSLTNKNLSTVKIYDDTVYIQYRFTKVGENDLSVESITLDVDYVKDETVIPECFWNKGTSTPQIVYNQGTGSNLFNPYNIVITIPLIIIATTIAIIILVIFFIIPYLLSLTLEL